MAVYTVRAISLTGTTKTLTHEAVSERDLEQQLEAEGLSIARIVSVSSPDEAIRGRLRMSNADLCDFSDRLRILYAAGIPIVDCFAELEQGAASTSQRSVARYLKHGVQHGRGVSDGARDDDVVLGRDHLGRRSRNGERARVRGVRGGVRRARLDLRFAGCAQ